MKVTGGTSLSWIATAKAWESGHAAQLTDLVEARRSEVRITIMDEMYDLEPLHEERLKPNACPVTPLKETRALSEE